MSRLPNPICIMEKETSSRVGSLRSKRAQKWVEPFLKRYMEDADDDDNAEIKQWMESLARFRVEIRRMFGPSNEANAATRIIQHLTQWKSASEYSTQFQQYSAKTDWDDNALMAMYRRGLKDNVKDEPEA